MPTDVLVDETPNINSDDKNFLLVHPTEVLHGNEKNGAYVSVSLRNADANSFVSASGVLSLFYG